MLSTKTVKIIKQDSEGNWYAIPAEQEDRFIDLVESVQNSEFLSSEWQQALDDVAAEFGEYIRVEA
jgi:hypothetical protein